jgi:hypothetical protein
VHKPDLDGGIPTASILQSNVRAFAVADSAATDKPERDAVVDLVFAAGVLAIVATLLLAFGARLGGPPPTIDFVSRYALLLLAPIGLLLLMLLAPGGVIRRSRPAWRLRAGLAVAGLGSFAVALVVLNLPLLLIAH